MEKGTRLNKGKLKWSLVSWLALEPMVRVLEFGAEKYDDWNWSKGLKYTEICESMLRHIHAFLGGEDDDNESKLQHVGHILCNAMFLSYMFLFRKDMDDRHVDNNLKKKYPFNEGDNYWTFDGENLICSCWDDQSEIMHDENPNKTYYKLIEVI